MVVIPAPPEIRLALDNDVFTHWRSQQSYVRKAIEDYLSIHKLVPALTSITVFEALSGFEKVTANSGELDYPIKRARIASEQLIQNCEVLPFDQNAAAIAAYIFPRLSKSDRNKHWKDVFIAATALAHGRAVATRNEKDFKLIANYLPPSHPVLHLAIWKP